jgi:pimeloyl-ACP methyl ester carboxylesterase
MSRGGECEAALADRRLSLELRQIDRPTLVIWGGRGRFVEGEQVARQRTSLPNADVIVLKESGHYPHLDSPIGSPRWRLPSSLTSWGDRGFLSQSYPPSPKPALPGEEKAPEYENR